MKQNRDYEIALFLKKTIIRTTYEEHHPVYNTRSDKIRYRKPLLTTMIGARVLVDNSCFNTKKISHIIIIESKNVYLLQ